MLELSPDEHLLAGALDAAEAELAGFSKRELRRRADYAWEMPALQLARSLAALGFAGAHPDLLRRHWRLERWLSEPPGVKPELADSTYGGSHPRHSDRMPNRPPVEVVVRAFEQGAATDADLIDHLVGPRGTYWNFRDLGNVSTRRWVRAGSATLAVVERVRERIVAVELARGEAPTQAAEAVRALSHSGGLDVLVGALVALGRERLVRGWSTDGEGRASVFSHMIATSHPGDGDTPERFAAAIREAKIGDRRLRELACYAPQWAAHVEATLARARPRRRRLVAARAHQGRPLERRGRRSRPSGSARSATARSSSARAARRRRGRRRAGSRRSASGSATRTSTRCSAAAKYGSTAGGHKRAELFARAMRGDLDDGELLERIAAKRHQDSVRALGLLPLPASGEARREALARRYEALHEFRRESRQFGKQRQGSESRATDIGLENLARTAGFSDPARLTLGDGGRVDRRPRRRRRDASSTTTSRVTLRVDADGKPEVAVRRGEKALKSVPAKLAQGPGDQGAHARAPPSCAGRARGSASRSSRRWCAATRSPATSWPRYREHPLLWPALSRLVLVAEGDLRLPGRRRARPARPRGRAARRRQRPSGCASPTRSTCSSAATGPPGSSDVLSRRVVQPFKQVFRELYLPVDAERTRRGRLAPLRRPPGPARPRAGAALGPRLADRRVRGRAAHRPSRARRRHPVVPQRLRQPGRRRAADARGGPVHAARATAATSRSTPCPPGCSARSCATSTSSSASPTSRGVDPRRASPASRCAPRSWPRPRALLSYDNVTHRRHRAR